MWTGHEDPRLILAPLKLEVLSLTPRVVVFADFLTPSEVVYIQDAARTSLERGAIFDWNNPAGITSYMRISKVSWLWDTHHPFLSSLDRRISLASGLSLESSEPYQVANYGLGGHYSPHDDAYTFEQNADEWKTGNGNRVATMLLYLTDVSLGGATAFVHLQLAVKPRCGSALFWYDVAPYSGNDEPIHFSFWHQKKAVEKLTNHVGCPVLWGSKWIATKWIRERNNVVVRFNYPGTSRVCLLVRFSSPGEIPSGPAAELPAKRNIALPSYRWVMLSQGGGADASSSSSRRPTLD
ncbi:hypothetical protein MTO96_033536 [Rhipicephalus appendiculatus]